MNTDKRRFVILFETNDRQEALLFKLPAKYKKNYDLVQLGSPSELGEHIQKGKKYKYYRVAQKKMMKNHDEVISRNIRKVHGLN